MPGPSLRPVSSWGRGCSVGQQWPCWELWVRASPKHRLSSQQGDLSGFTPAFAVSRPLQLQFGKMLSKRCLELPVPFSSTALVGEPRVPACHAAASSPPPAAACPLSLLWQAAGIWQWVTAPGLWQGLVQSESLRDTFSPWIKARNTHRFKMEFGTGLFSCQFWPAPVPASFYRCKVTVYSHRGR